MNIKKIISIVLIVIFLIAQFNFVAFINPVNAIDTEDTHYKYYYSQLSDEAKKIYDAMCEMYNSDKLKTGNANYDLVAKGKVTEAQVKAHQTGSNDLIIAVETARDAFYLDYPEVFYINIQKYSIRITADKSGYHVWLGTGNNDSYYQEGISSKDFVDSAEIQYQTELNNLINGAKALENSYIGEELKVKQIEYIHDEIIKNTTYKLDNDCKVENRSFIRTPYGALVGKEAACEGYAKSLKVVLDKLGIPCILVRGAYKNGTVNPERHMWAYVQLSEKWYAVDVTFDDPDKLNRKGTIDIEKDYFLAGESVMSKGHYPEGIMSADEFEFTYPDLELISYGEKEVANANGLNVTYTVVPYDGNTYVDLGVSYKGMNFSEAKNAGYHFLTKYYNDVNELASEKWGYIDTVIYPSMITEETGKFKMPVYSIPYIEIAVTDIAIDEKAYSSDFNVAKDYFYFQGDESMFLASSGIIGLPDATYIAPPKIVSASPYVDSKLKAGKTTHIKISYNENLVKSAEDIEPSCYITTKNAWTTSATENSSISNFKWNAKTVEFDFTPSTQWGDNSVIYYFNISGLVGETSNKTPNPSYYYVQDTFGCTYSMAKANAWKVYGRPTLIDDGNTSVEGWKLSDGTTISKTEAENFKNITDRLALVVDKTSSEQTEKMNSLIESKTNSKILSSETYNINLILCNKKVLSTANGDKVTVYLGFPEGYGPNDAGVTFKTYHFKTTSGGITEVEEIPCVVTPYGLLVTCSSFSPFEVVAMQKSADDISNTSKSFITIADENGMFEGLENNIVTLSSGEEKTFTIKANNQYQINSLMVFGEYVTDAVGKDNYSVTIKYEDIKDTNNVVNVSFVSKNIVQEEEARGEKVVDQNTEPIQFSGFDVSLEATKKTVKPGEVFEVNAYLKNLNNIENGIIALAGQLEFDTSVLEIYKKDSTDEILIGENGWNLNAFNETNFKFIADNNKYITNNSHIFTVYFKVNSNITTEKDVRIALKDVSASGGNGVILPVNNADETIHIEIKDEITSTKYKIDDIDKIIYRILPNTTVADFRKNVNSNQTIIFTNSEGDVLTDTDFITTGTKVNIGKTLEYTLVVIGDIDGDGKINVNDLAKLKLHLINIQDLTGIYLLAADIDCSNDLNINDLAQLKLILIGNLILE